jgi:hypothetical protein
VAWLYRSIDYQRVSTAVPQLFEISRFSQVFRNWIAKSKYSKNPDFWQAVSGHIVLQDHHDGVHFKSIKIREF